MRVDPQRQVQLRPQLVSWRTGARPARWSMTNKSSPLGNAPVPEPENRLPSVSATKRPEQPRPKEEQTWYGLLAFVLIMVLFLGGLGISIARSFF